jgi:K+-sensing histidine kinase KdpD
MNVIYSILHNATKYADRGSEITVVWASEPPAAVLKVRSIGHPIAAQDRERIFRKFGRGRETEGREKGADGVGLGLWIGRTLMERVKGELRLEDEDPQNPRATTFLVKFPPCFV